jgi:hypothetical protein
VPLIQPSPDRQTLSYTPGNMPDSDVIAPTRPLQPPATLYVIIVLCTPIDGVCSLAENAYEQDQTCEMGALMLCLMI